MKKEELYKKAIGLWGVDFQFDMLQEECMELAVAVLHWKRGRPNGFNNFIEEIADVEIILEVTKMILGHDDYKATRRITDTKIKKLKRLKERIEKANK